MPENHSHHHSHRFKENYGSNFKRKSLSSIAFRRHADKWMKICFFTLSAVMIVLVVLAYLYG